MDYKTILVHVDGTPAADLRTALAAQLALRFGAHLTGVALTGVSRLFYQDASADLVRMALAPRLDALYRKTERDLARFARLAAGTGLGSHEARLVDDETGDGIALSARYADLLVMGQADSGAAPPAGGDPLPYVLLACARPLLAVPSAWREAAIGRHILLAWNGSDEAARALDAALPLMRQAASVTAAVFGAGDGAPGLPPYLARQGVDVRMVVETGHQDIGERLLSLLADLGADLLVMGGYGRARLSEFVLGGVTRTVLGAMTVPVLLAH